MSEEDYVGGAIKSKLSRIRENLRENPRVHVIDEKIEKYLDKDNKVYLPTEISFYVAPKKSTLDCSELNVFMMGLIPDVEPTTYWGFKEDRSFFRSEIEFGALLYRERLGEWETKSTFRLDDKDLFNQFGFSGANRVVHDFKQGVNRKISIFPFPNIGYAAAAFKEESFLTRSSIRQIKKLDNL